MEPIEVLPVFLSLDSTAGLVAQGLRAPWTGGVNAGDAAVYTLPVTGASNTSPIVITTTARLGGNSELRTGRVFHVVVAGVLGNTAANKLDAQTLRNEAWIAIVTSAEGAATTTLALYDLDVSTGELVASTGNGAYTSGGTISKAYLDGQILIGQEYIGETSGAPRVVMVPKRCTYEPRSEASSWTVAAIADGEPDREELAPAIRTEWIWYETHVWGKGADTTASPASVQSFGVVQRMTHQLIRSAQNRCSGVFDLGNGVFLDQVEGAPQRLKYGHEYVFDIGLAVPVQRDAVEFAPEGTDMTATIQMQINGGEPEPIEEA